VAEKKILKTGGKAKKKRSPKLIVGWREWLSIPELGIPSIKAKVDTGARSSALHAHSIEEYQEGGITMVRFIAEIDQPSHRIEHKCHAAVYDQRQVKDSAGNPEVRYFIRTLIEVGDHHWPVEVSLTDRSTMKFPMLLGREAVRRRAVVDPGRSYLTRKPPPKSPIAKKSSLPSSES
jgi:hypothetical protein